MQQKTKPKHYGKMRVKHFAGYGTVNVTKMSKEKFTNEHGEEKTKMVLFVKGNHEWGLECDDIYNVRSWIFDKFEKSFNGKDYEIDMDIDPDYVNENGEDVMVATYTFIY